MDKTNIISHHPFLRNRRILTIGGSKITASNAKFCRILGRLLAQEPNLILVTGGLLRVGNSEGLDSADWSFVAGARELLNKYSRTEEMRIETVLPGHDISGVKRFNAGKTIILKKKTPQARRFAVVNSVDVVLTVEGKTGTREQIDLALAIEKPVLPLPFTRGKSKKAWERNREEIMALFGINEDTSQEWESVSISKLKKVELERLAASVKEHLMHRLKRRCFIMMPYLNELEPLYENAIKPAVIEAGMTPIRSDQLDLIGNALKALRDEIDSCECAVAVTTKWKPNVMYELGLVHASGKPIIILHKLNKKGDLPRIPFDLSTEYFIGYLPENLNSLQKKICCILQSQTPKF